VGTLHWELCTCIWGIIHALGNVPCLEIHDIALGSMMLHWDPCTHIWSYPSTLGSMPFALGSMYFIGIRVIALGSMTVHRAMTGMPHHHSCHMDCFRRVPCLVGSYCPTHVPHSLSWTTHVEVVEVVEDLDQVVTDKHGPRLLQFWTKLLHSWLQVVELVISFWTLHT
jgi:hypothetical protein